MLFVILSCAFLLLQRSQIANLKILCVTSATQTSVRTPAAIFCPDGVKSHCHLATLTMAAQDAIRTRPYYWNCGCRVPSTQYGGATRQQQTVDCTVTIPCTAIAGNPFDVGKSTVLNGRQLRRGAVAIREVSGDEIRGCDGRAPETGIGGPRRAHRMRGGRREAIAGSSQVQSTRSIVCPAV